MNARHFDQLVERLRATAAQLPDRRTGDNTQYSMADIALSAFAVFFTQSPSFLSFQKLMEQHCGCSNARSLFRIERFPTDNHNAVPLTDRDDALKANWCELTVTDAEGKIKYRNAFITDWAIRTDNVAGLVAAGRARWMIENESNNVLKNRGYHLEHNFGHSQRHLSSLLLTMNLLAFALHTFLELGDESYRLIRAQLGARRTFFQHLQAVTTYWHFEGWEPLMDFMMRGLEIGPYAAAKN